ncbi:uncharacterized protein PAC_10560 [Phialocephala subalpina]|uniref:Alpha/beta hydrolase fold-3 domain-containing protein n=1 Tax=Phialocephala subalpina TaxID=576137 RepID=A0A1L7X6M7_9HELO|nr:uncharacterized protein PAC_10560 [Phialocephala subalpina]
MPSLIFGLKIYLIRLITSIYFYLDRHHSTPLPPPPSFTLRIPTTDKKSKLKLYFYTPPSPTLPKTPTKNPNPAKHPTIINFHGGGWTYGTPQKDARFAAEVTKAGYLFVSVQYRLFPEFGHPTQLNDCSAAVLWINEHGEQYGIDPTKLVLTGWSTGGQLVFSTAYSLASQVSLAGIISFYPLVDFSTPRSVKEERCPIAVQRSKTPKLFKEISEMYGAASGPERSGPFMSPGLASDEMLRRLPGKVAVYTCEWDTLCFEGEEFRERLRGLGKGVGGYMVSGVVHAWDKFPTFKRGDGKRDKLYGDAVRELREMFEK